MKVYQKVNTMKFCLRKVSTSPLLKFKSLIFLIGVISLFTAAFVYHSADSKRPLAIVRQLKPKVKVNHIEDDTIGWTSATRGHQLFDSDTLVTGSNGYAAVQFMDNSTAKIKPNSLLILNGEVNDKNSTANRLALEAGELFLNVKERRSDFEVSGQSSLAVVQGTEFGAEADQSGSNRFWVASGTVQLTALRSGESVNLTQGMFGEVNADGTSLTSGYLSDDELDQLLEEYENFDERTTPEELKLQFQNDEGDTREIDIQYYQN